MPAPPSPREEAIADLVRVLKALPAQASVTVISGYAHVTIAVPSGEELPPPAAPRDDDERDCRDDLATVLGEAGRRLTTNQLLSELSRRNWLWGEATVRRHLAAMVSDGTLTNDSRARPPGYGPAASGTTA